MRYALMKRKRVGERGFLVRTSVSWGLGDGERDFVEMYLNDSSFKKISAFTAVCVRFCLKSCRTTSP